MPIDSTLVAVQETTTVISDYAESTGYVLQTAGQQGPAGPAGQDLATTTSILNATAPAYVALTALGTPGNHPVIGITIVSGVSGEAVQIQQAGTLTNTAWTWVPNNPIYAMSDGTLTQTVPTSGLLSIVGYAATATKMFVKPEPVIALI